jgi:hypothetical protein
MLSELLLVPVALDTVAMIFDVVQTERGIKKGVGVEANEVIDAVARTDKPSAVFLYIWNYAFIAAVFVAALEMIDRGAGTNLLPIGFGGGLAVLLADAAKHVQGGLKWRYLLAGGKLDFDGFPVSADGKAQSHSVLAKFIGPWIF